MGAETESIQSLRADVSFLHNEETSGYYLTLGLLSNGNTVIVHDATFVKQHDVLQDNPIWYLMLAGP